MLLDEPTKPPVRSELLPVVVTVPVANDVVMVLIDVPTKPPEWFDVLVTLPEALEVLMALLL